MEKTRSVGVGIFSVLLFIFSLFSLWYYFRGASEGFERLLSLIMIIASSIAAGGTFTLKRWARILALCIASLILVYFVSGLFSAYFGSDETKAYFAAIVFIYLPFVIFGIACIFYLTRPKVKRQFTKAESSATKGSPRIKEQLS